MGTLTEVKTEMLIKHPELMAPEYADFWPHIDAYWAWATACILCEEPFVPSSAWPVEMLGMGWISFTLANIVVLDDEIFNGSEFSFVQEAPGAYGHFNNPSVTFYNCDFQILALAEPQDCSVWLSDCWEVESWGLLEDMGCFAPIWEAMMHTLPWVSKFFEDASADTELGIVLTLSGFTLHESEGALMEVMSSSVFGLFMSLQDRPAVTKVFQDLYNQYIGNNSVKDFAPIVYVNRNEDLCCGLSLCIGNPLPTDLVFATAEVKTKNTNYLLNDGGIGDIAGSGGFLSYNNTATGPINVLINNVVPDSSSGYLYHFEYIVETGWFHLVAYEGRWRTLDSVSCHLIPVCFPSLFHKHTDCTYNVFLRMSVPYI